jgi:hypothetical protein
MLTAGLWEGLVYLGLPLPSGNADLHAGHGPIMVLGFLGTVIAIERAVALDRWWTWLAPAGAAVGGLAVAAGVPDEVGQALVVAGGVVLVGVFATLHRVQPSAHNTVMAAGAVCWVVAAILWLAGWPVPRFVAWLVGFLVLTIAGERLELSRLTGASQRARALFLIAASLLFAGLIVTVPYASAGTRLAGVGLLALAVWLAHYDIARRTIHSRNVTQYIAAALLIGYVWLAAGGALWVAAGQRDHGWSYDAMLHTIFLGFVMSMIFAHAPIIVPAVTGRPLHYRPTLYLALALLHISLLVRLIGGDAIHNRVAWQTGGVLNEVALLTFLAIAGSAFRSRGSHPSHR